MKSAIVIVATALLIVAFGCGKAKTPDQSMHGGSSTDSASLLDGSAPSRHGSMTATVISAADAPVSSAITSCVEQSLGAAGYSIMHGLDTDVIVICRAHPRNGAGEEAAAAKAIAGTPFYDRSTSIVAEDTLIRIPPQWQPSRPPSRWLVTVEMRYSTTTVDSAATQEALDRIDVLVGTQGIGPSFTRNDLNSLWSALEQCAAAGLRK